MGICGQLPPDFTVARLNISILALEVGSGCLPSQSVLTQRCQLRSPRHFGSGLDGRAGLPCSCGSTAWGLLLLMTTSKNCHHLPLPCHRVDLPTCLSWVGTQAEEAGLWCNLDPFMCHWGLCAIISPAGGWDASDLTVMGQNIIALSVTISRHQLV